MITYLGDKIMACCGRRLAAATPEQGLAVDGTAAPVGFRYTGPRTLVVRGPVTGRDYRFSSGFSLWVDARDARSFAGIPGLARRSG